MTIRIDAETSHTQVCSHSPGFDQRRPPEALRAAMAARPCSVSSPATFIAFGHWEGWEGWYDDPIEANDDYNRGGSREPSQPSQPSQTVLPTANFGPFH